MWCGLLFVFIVVPKCSSQFIYTETHQISYPIAGIFERDAVIQRLAFNESMRQAFLGDQQVDPEESSGKINVNDLRLEPIILEPLRADSYSVWREMCSNRDMRPIAIFGPQNPISDGAIRDQCAIANIPHIQATWQPLDPDQEFDNNPVEDDDSTNTASFKKISINFYPPAEEISYAYAMLLKYYKWENFAVLYEDDFGLMRIQKIFAEHAEQHPIIVRRLNPVGDNNKIFKELVKNQESRILLDCHVDNVMKYLNEAGALNMTNYYQVMKYIIT